MKSETAQPPADPTCPLLVSRETKTEKLEDRETRELLKLEKREILILEIVTSCSERENVEDYEARKKDYHESCKRML